MKLLFILFFYMPLAAQDSPLEVFRVPGFSAGIVSRYSPILIPDNSIQNGRNIYVDELGISRRKGYSQFNSVPFTDEKSVRMVSPFTADDGTRYLLALSNQTIYKAATDGVFSAIPGLSGLSAISDMDAVAYLGKIWFANGTDSMAYWTGASTKTVTEGPLGGMIEGWRNRIVTAGVAGSLSYVYMSKELDGEEWTTGPTTSVDPVALAFGGTNAKPIKCVYAGYRDFLFVGNEDELYGVYGFGRNDFVVRTISREVGCIEDKSVQEKDGSLYWMSRRGIEKMTTQAGINRISDGVKDVFDTIINNTAQNRIKLYSTQAQWEAGNLSASGPGAKMSATISPDSVVPSTWAHTDTDGADWFAGTLVNIDTYTIDGSIMMKYPTIKRLLDDFSDGNYSSNPVWTVYGTNNFAVQIAPNYCYGESGTEFAYSHLCYFSQTVGAKTGQIYVTTTTLAYGEWSFDVGAMKYATYSYSINDVYFISSSSDTSITNGYMFRLDGTAKTCGLYRVDAGVLTLLASVAVTGLEPVQYVRIGTYIGGNFRVYRDYTGAFSVTTLDSGFGTSCTLNATDNTYSSSQYFIGKSVLQINTETYTAAHLAKIYISQEFPTSGTFTSPIYDTSFSTPTGGPFSFSETVPVGSTIAYSVCQSTYNSTSGMGAWVLASTTTSGAYRIPLTQEFWQYKAELSTQYSTQTPSIQSVSLQAATTGDYIHECADTSGAASWGNFQANSVLDGGTISYFVSTGATCAEVQSTTATWNAQLNNAPIAISTAIYTGIKEVFTIDSATQTALLRDVTINWLEGTARPPVASSIFAERYYLSYTTNSTSGVNDFMYVADKNDAPTFLENMNCYSLTIFNRKMFCGDANATGKIYQMETGESDNGLAFTSSFRTKAYSFGDTDAEKEFVKMYASFAPEAESILDINLTPSYRLDLSTTAIVLNAVNTGEDATAGMLVAKIPFAVSNNLTGRFMDVNFTHTGNTGGWTMFGLSFYFRTFSVK